MVHIDLKVQPPLPKQDVTKHPKSHKTSQIDIIANIFNQLNAPNDIIPLPLWLYNRQTIEGTPILQEMLPKANLNDLFMLCQSSRVNLYAMLKYLHHANKIVPI